MNLGVVAGIDGRHPDLFTAQAERGLDGGWVEASDVVIEHDAAVDPDVREDALHQVGAGDGALVMALEDDRLQSGISCCPHDVEIVS